MTADEQKKLSLDDILAQMPGELDDEESLQRALDGLRWKRFSGIAEIEFKKGRPVSLRERPVGDKKDNDPQAGSPSAVTR